MFGPGDICSKCKGQCCQWSTGSWSTDQFESLESEILDLVLSGRATVGRDMVDGFRYLCPPTTTGMDLGTCIFLTPSGCSLPREKRPFECLALEPRGDGRCVAHGSNTREQWIPYQDILEILEDFEYEHKY